MGKPSKNQLKSTAANAKDAQVKYDDPRMAYNSTKEDMVIKESTISMKTIFGDGIPTENTNIVVCEDHLGFYLTSKALVNVPILDPYRTYHRNNTYTITKNEDNTFKIVKDTFEFVI